MRRKNSRSPSRVKAYDYLKANKKKAKKRPVVALIGTGMDVEHEDLKHAIWMNPKEKLNQKDDDKNGLVDNLIVLFSIENIVSIFIF